MRSAWLVVMLAGCRSVFGFDDPKLETPRDADATPDHALTVCDPLTGPSDGTLVLDGMNPGATASYTCNANFELVGDAIRTCDSAGHWSGTDPTCSKVCPCFNSAQLDAIEADIVAGGGRICQVDSVGGGTTQTLLLSSHATFRIRAEALENASLPTTHLACGFGCLDTTSNDGVDDCAGQPANLSIQNLSTADHALCRAMIAARCP